jgi:cytoskeletal protein CcmA (bactofilin family)
MLGNFKGKGPEKEGDPVTAVGRAPSPPSFPSRPQPAAEPEVVSIIASDMTVVGNIVCEGRAEIYGRVDGEIGAVELMVGEGANVSGNVVAQELTICGHVSGTIRAVRVKLKGSAVVQGDIFHRSLSIEENAQFEGSSRRVENPIESKSATASRAPVSSMAEPVVSTTAGPTNGADLMPPSQQVLQTLSQAGLADTDSTRM